MFIDSHHMALTSLNLFDLPGVILFIIKHLVNTGLQISQASKRLESFQDPTLNYCHVLSQYSFKNMSQNESLIRTVLLSYFVIIRIKFYIYKSVSNYCHILLQCCFKIISQKESLIRSLLLSFFVLSKINFAIIKFCQTIVIDLLQYRFKKIPKRNLSSGPIRSVLSRSTIVV